jgi:protein gp37
MSRTTIEWTQATWNPVRGCSPVSPGCAHCYAERQAGRFCGPGQPFEGFAQIGKNGRSGARWTGKVELIPEMLTIPLRTRTPTTWFVNSMSDLFHESLPDEAIDRVFATMALCPQHTFQILTKRSARMKDYWRAGLRDRWWNVLTDERNWPDNWRESRQGNPSRAAVAEGIAKGWRSLTLPNVWLGVSCENEYHGAGRVFLLLQTPAAVRFVSAEPLLGPIRFGSWLTELDWVIVGGESGPGARRFNIDWARSIRNECRSAKIPVFIKQLGSNPCCGALALNLKDRKGGDMEEWPEDLRIRETPAIHKTDGH